VSDLGWEIYPQGLGILLSEIHTKYPSLPIIITENGIADSKDINRAEYISSHLKEVENALNRNIPVEGYCYWSLMDNFEWAEGFTPRFGLYQVDYVTFKRNQRKSSEYLKQIIVNKTALSQAVK
ncbi:MAG: family 1 glycosylhydrolase, partial [Bdellovibrio sp.]